MTFNMTNTSYSDFKNICRICMLNCDVKFDRDIVISDIFYKLTDIHFGTNKELPQQICLKCFKKVNEIHEFAFQCKESHSSLLQCLNNFKNSRMKDEQDISAKINEPFKPEEKIIIDEHEIDNASNLTTEHFIDAFELKKNKKNELEENIILGTSDDKNINNSEDDLLKQITPIIEVVNEQSNENVNLNDPNKDTSCEDQYKCKLCSMSFAHLFHLIKHMRLHTGQRPYKCEPCSKTFTHFCHMKQHMRMHSGERPYKCEQCLKSFSYSFTLKRHMDTHNDTYDYKCEQCSKSFSQSSYLKRHMSVHSDERSYECKHCSKVYVRLESLKRHMRSHTVERTFKCNQCSKSFAKSLSLKSHMCEQSS